MNPLSAFGKRTPGKSRRVVLDKPGTMVMVLLCWLIVSVSGNGATFYVDVSNRLPVAPFTNWPTAAANIQDAIDAAADGDLILVTDGVYATGGRVVYGALTNRVVIDKAVTVESVHGPSATFIQGNSISGSNAVRCVYLATNSVLIGFTLTNGGTLASGDATLEESGAGTWTTNGSGAVISNCFFTRNVAAAEGGGAFNGFIFESSFMENSASSGGGYASEQLSSTSGSGVLSNCLLQGNVASGVGGGTFNGLIFNSTILQHSAYSGGGVAAFNLSSTVIGCSIAGNSATAYGGGAYESTLKNCRVLQNIASSGGGTEFGSLYNCVVANNTATGNGAGGIDIAQQVSNCSIVGNSAVRDAGGIDGVSLLANCIVYYNTTSDGSPPNVAVGTSLYFCCTFPLPQNGNNNVTNEPGFVDPDNGDYHLQPSSPCINSGQNSWVPNSMTNDLDGEPRIIDGLVDIGACEYQVANSTLPFLWAQQYGLSLDGTIDSDGDGVDNWAEAVAGTIPTNAASFLKINSMSTSTGHVVITWSGAAYRTYYVQRSTNLISDPFTVIYTNRTITAQNCSAADRLRTNSSSCFYRLLVQ